MMLVYTNDNLFSWIEHLSKFEWTSLDNSSHMSKSREETKALKSLKNQ